MDKLIDEAKKSLKITVSQINWLWSKAILLGMSHRNRDYRREVLKRDLFVEKF